ncbi:hypothetical protein TSUD_157350 [Trifolium subterraneum]|uniref:Aluminum-activated malate transporter n=1 Tax=Trifolium subterraneum TaxID=3900 RepID=A0A2Z6MHE8_TRISU|nr:hypothetical protein TSUD_157350 [Trifolium subterraneum]
MTVVVVFEFTAGATLCKGLNRGLGTLLAGLLAFLLDYVANASGQTLQAVFIAVATPQSVRVLFKDPCIRLAAEVSKVLIELANSIRSRRHCSPEILSDHLHEALQDLNTAIKSQPRLFLGPNDIQANNMLATIATSHGKSSLSSVKTDSSALLDWKTKRLSSEQTNEAEQGPERKVLRSQTSRIAITSLEFSEALPFAAFASLLVETVAKLDLIIDEVEELGRLACFKEYKPGDEFSVSCETPRVDVLENHLPSHGGE